MINSATQSPPLMGSRYTPPIGQDNVQFKMSGGFKPPTITPHQQNKFPPNPAMAKPAATTTNLEALSLTPPSGDPRPMPLPAQTHLNPKSHEAVNGAYGATQSPPLMGSRYTPPIGQDNVQFEMSGGFKPPTITPHQQNKFPPNPAMAKPAATTTNLEALSLTPPSGDPRPKPLPAQTHLNPMSHETVNGAYVKKGFEQLHASINDNVALQRKTAQTAFNRKVEVKKNSHQNVQIFNSSLSVVAQMNEKSSELKRISSNTMALKAYTRELSDHQAMRQLESQNQTSQKIAQTTRDGNVASEKVAQYSRSIEAQNSRDNASDNERVSKEQNRQRIMASNQNYKTQSKNKSIEHHQSSDATTQTLRRSTQAHRAYLHHNSDTAIFQKAKNIYEFQGHQINQEKQKADLNRNTAIHDHYQASDFKRAAAAQLYSANQKAGSKSLTIKDPAGTSAF